MMPNNPDSIWVGKMNQLRQRVASRAPETLAAINMLEMKQCDYEIMKLYVALNGAVNIRWKDSIAKVVARTTLPNGKHFIQSQPTGGLSRKPRSIL